MLRLHLSRLSSSCRDWIGRGVYPHGQRHVLFDQVFLLDHVVISLQSHQLARHVEKDPQRLRTLRLQQILADLPRCDDSLNRFMRHPLADLSAIVAHKYSMSW
jgi:hypothetical protein